MLEALWSLEFGSSSGYEGAGVVIFETGRIFGGDAQYYYTGKYSLKDGTMSADVKVNRYCDGFGSIFGTNEQEFDLKVIGKVELPTMTATGHRVDDPTARIEVRLTRRAELP
jgi:T3SS negative regulator,GrlR